MPNAFNVFIDVDNNTMATRLFNSDRTGKESVKTLEEALNECTTRYKADRDKYKKLYNVDCDDMSNYHYVIDNSNLTPEQTADKIYEEYLKFINKTKD
jgi:cytidylate kinase